MLFLVVALTMLGVSHGFDHVIGPADHLERYAMQKILSGCIGEDLVMQLRSDLMQATEECSQDVDEITTVEPYTTYGFTTEVPTTDITTLVTTDVPTIQQTLTTGVETTEQTTEVPTFEQPLTTEVPTSEQPMAETQTLSDLPTTTLTPNTTETQRLIPWFIPIYDNVPVQFYPYAFPKDFLFPQEIVLPKIITFPGENEQQNTLVGSRRKRRELSLLGNLIGTDEPTYDDSALQSMTCGLRRIKWLTGANQINFPHLDNLISSLNVSSSLKEDLLFTHAICENFSMCMPQDRDDQIFPILKDLAHVFAYMKCSSRKAVTACMKEDFRKARPKTNTEEEGQGEEKEDTMIEHRTGEKVKDMKMDMGMEMDLDILTETDNEDPSQIISDLFDLVF